MMISAREALNRLREGNLRFMSDARASEVAEIVTEPIPVPVTRPLFTIAIAASDVVQAAEFVTSVCVNELGEF